VEEAKSIADSLGYPVLLKSAFGGGGRGIREVGNEAEFKQGFARATNEAKGAFGRAGMYVEKLIAPARHVEIQVLSDGRETRFGSAKGSAASRDATRSLSS
jgi:acetyl/propionyl-CoA carboxylase alpha subunit